MKSYPSDDLSLTHSIGPPATSGVSSIEPFMAEAVVAMMTFKQ